MQMALEMTYCLCLFPCGWIGMCAIRSIQPIQDNIVRSSIFNKFYKVVHFLRGRFEISVIPDQSDLHDGFLQAFVFFCGNVLRFEYILAAITFATAKKNSVIFPSFSKKIRTHLWLTLAKWPLDPNSAITSCNCCVQVFVRMVSLLSRKLSIRSTFSTMLSPCCRQNVQ